MPEDRHFSHDRLLLAFKSPKKASVFGCSRSSAYATPPVSRSLGSGMKVTLGGASSSNSSSLSSAPSSCLGSAASSLYSSSTSDSASLALTFLTGLPLPQAFLAVLSRSTASESDSGSKYLLV